MDGVRLIMKLTSVVSLVLVAGLSFGRHGNTPPEVTVSFKSPKAKVGSVVPGVITITFAEGLHGYQNPPTDEFQIPVKVSVTEAGFKLAGATYPKGVGYTPVGETKPIKIYRGTIQIPFKLRVASKAANYDVNFKVDYQLCSDKACFPPASLIAKGKLSVSGK
jgi:DsbC/DsbD-like thiol-disulfide interchange protein